MTQTAVLHWIKTNLGAVIQQAILAFPGVIYSEDWLAAITMRETGILLYKYLPHEQEGTKISPLMIGDSGHGYGFTQIDNRSFPDFINSGDWEIPLNQYQQTIKILEDKRKYLEGKVPNTYDFDRVITASWNCGQGNELKAIEQGKDVDAYTFNRDYSKAVWEYRAIYKSLS